MKSLTNLARNALLIGAGSLILSGCDKSLKNCTLEYYSHGNITKRIENVPLPSSMRRTRFVEYRDNEGNIGFYSESFSYFCQNKR